MNWKKMFGNDGPPKLTVLASKVSAELDGLGGKEKLAAQQTIAALVLSVRTMSSLPTAIGDQLWEILMAFGWKAFSGGNPEKMFEDLLNGCSPSLRTLIEKEAAK